MAGGGAAPAGVASRSDQYHGTFTWRVVIAAFVAACGGMIFGWDIGVTGGVETFDSWKLRFFPHLLDISPETSIYCKYNDALLQLFTSSLFLAGAFSALVGGWSTKKYGRRFTIVVGGIFFLIGTILQSTSYALAQLIIGRVVLGVGVGLVNQAVPMYLSEMAPFQYRGALNVMFQLMTTIGIFVAQLVNYKMTTVAGDWNWRISVGVVGAPALVMTIGTWLLNDSPSGMVERGLFAEAKAELSKIRGCEDVEAEYQDMVDSAMATGAVKNPWKSIAKRRYLPQLVIAVCMPAFQQLSGINSIMFYAPQIFETLGHGNESALLNTVIMGAVNVGSTFVAIAFVDYFGRKALLLEGGGQMIIALFSTGAVLGAGFNKYGAALPDSWAAAVLFLICLFVSAFAWSWGPLAWLVPTEIQPLETRSAGMAITTSINFLFTFFIGQAFQSMLCGMEFGVFMFFGGWVIIMTIFVATLLPETKRVPLEEVEGLFRRHFIWGKLLDCAEVNAEYAAGHKMIMEDGALAPRPIAN
eukprot:CAMPEP_0119105134 /NCGR_PEP_ID=MMETSP1180-20130426/3181_1 /TAXON_ID=3052 ORGANISM="Chlamydomonas cf sp, Strain CCMP681" /NCGR_SAMPLE_ID=MMETSP1180 /ASSEMBLY_ACC=CAM_ASM_000741 /LENGTH=526 /DNA_ID=CAMNT_0007090117 /DNA_START=128 /DNA_END=1708 /DNA_ORIENTATION=+